MILAILALCFGAWASAQTLGSVLKDGIVLGGKSSSPRPAADAPGVTVSVHRDPAGFRVALPAGWTVEKAERGQVSMVAADRSEFVSIVPVLARDGDCGSVLRGAFANRWGMFPGAGNVNVTASGRGLAVANFGFRNGQSRGAALCAETSRRTAMVYAVAAPAQQFAASKPKLLAVLRSFRYEAAPRAQNTAGVAAPAPAVAMEPFREPSEGAYTAEKPAGWRVEGGVLRISNNDVRNGHRLISPDGGAAIILGDVRLNSCLIPGQNTFGVQQPMQGMDWCPFRQAEQVAEEYVQRIAAEWRIQGARVISRRPRPDLVPKIQLPAGFRYLCGEAVFEGTRGGQPVAGAFVTTLLFLQSPDATLTGGQYSREVAGYIGPAAREPEIAALFGRVASSVRWNVQWVMANRAAAQRDHQAIMRSLEESRQNGQRMFEERMAAADRRARGVDDVLSGTVRLTDGQGNHYRAKAGSNYYFRDDDAARTESDPDKTVIGTDVWAADGSVNLTPLEVVQ
ncbi:MAG: hypothetical protein U0Q16_32830 [Bryobacteraceae bacterium]